MTKERKELVARMVAIYGPDHFLVKEYASLAEKYEENDWNNKVLKLLVSAHEAYPFTGEGEY